MMSCASRKMAAAATIASGNFRRGEPSRRIDVAVLNRTDEGDNDELFQKLPRFSL
jgi:hypothetical protein